MTETVIKPASEQSDADVPGLLLGDFLYSSQPSKQNESDARLILRMAMTGESLEELTTNLQKTYGPLMTLTVLMKLMGARQEEGRTLFYSELPESLSKEKSTTGARRSDRSPQQSSARFGSIHCGRLNSVQRSVKRFQRTIGTRLLERDGLADYLSTAWKVVRGLLQKRSTRRQCRPMFACLASSNDTPAADMPYTVGETVDVAPPPAEDLVTETVPMEVALRLLANSKENYSLVVDKADIKKKEGSEKESQTPVFSVKGVQFKVDTTKGPVTLIPMFFSKNEVQRTFTLVRDFLRHLWLTNRARRRSQICNKFVSEISSLTGIDKLMSDQKPVTRSSAEDPEDDEGLGDADPPEMKEFIEELEETGQEFMTKSTPSLLGLPLIFLFGCLTVSTSLWNDCTSFLDLMLIKSPLESFVLGIPKTIPFHSLQLESCVQKCYEHNCRLKFLKDSQTSNAGAFTLSSNERVEDGPRTVAWLEIMQLLVVGVWRLANLSRSNVATNVNVSLPVNNIDVIPNVRKLRKATGARVVGTVVDVEHRQYQTLPDANTAPDAVSFTRMDVSLCFNLHKTFDEKSDGKETFPEPFDPTAALGLCLIGNLGLQTLTSHVPSLGFTDVSNLKNGISCQHLES